MSVASELSPDLLDLAVAVGLLTGEPPDVELNEDWFSDLGGHLSRVLSDDEQRAAVLRLAARVLGSAAPEELDLRDLPAGETWLPVAASGSPRAGLFVIVAEQPDGDVLLSLGGRFAAEDTLAGRELETAATLAVPLVRVRAGAPAEFLIGSAEGRLRAGVAISAEHGLLGEGEGIELRSVGLDVAIPTDGSPATLAVALRGLRLPGEGAARDRSISDPEQLGAEVVELLVGLLRAQAGSASDELGHLLALLGISPPPGVPALAPADLLGRGPSALADWARAIAADAAALRAWLGELAGLLGAAAVTGSGSDEDPFAIEVTSAPRGRLLLRVLRDPATGATVLRPAVSLALGSEAAAAVAGAASVEAELVALRLGPIVSAIAFPNIVAALRLGNGAAPLVDTTIPPSGTSVRIGQARAGLALDAARRVVPLLELRDVVVGSETHPVIDLSSAQAVVEAAAGALDAVAQALLDALDTIPEGAALAALAGITRPSSVPDDGDWPALVSLPQLFAGPLREIGCYHARVLQRAGAWRELAAELATLLRATGLAATAPQGEGTREIPWTTPVFHDPGIGILELLVWTIEVDDRAELSLGARIRPRAADIAGRQLSLTLQSEALRVSLPAGSCAPPFPALFFPQHTLTARLGDDLDLDAGVVDLLCERIEAALRWGPADGLQRAFAIVDARLRVDGEEHDLPEIELGFGSDDLGLDFGSLPWRALEALAGRALAALGAWPATLARALGWTPGAGDLQVTLPRLPGIALTLAPEQLPRMSLQLLALDPAGAVCEWLSALLRADESGGPDLSVVLAGWLGALLPAGVEPDADALTVAVSGSGTHADPWAIRIAPGAEVPELLLWLDPDGPSLVDLPGLIESLVPVDFGDGVESLVEALEQAAEIVPELAQALDGRPDLATALTALRARLVDTDGLVSASAQAPGAPWTSAALGDVAHLRQPAAFDPAAHLPAGAPAPDRQVFLAAALPGVADWPARETAHIIDLRTPGLAPEAFDLTNLPATGPYVLLMPTRVAAGGVDGVVARLRRALTAIRAAAGAPLCVIAHSTSGVAARIVAGEPGISHLVTIGTPHAGATFPWLAQDAPADAVRALQTLRDLAAPDPAALDELLATLGAALDANLPADDFAAVAFPPLHADVGAARAVTAAVDAATLDAALTDAVRRALAAAAALVPGWSAEPVTHAGVGVRVALPLTPVGADPIAVNGRARVDLARLELRPGAPRRLPRLDATVELRRPDGWLAGAPGSDPRVRWAEIELSVELADPLHASTALTLHEAAVFGLARREWRIDDGLITPGGDDTGTLAPDARVLLGELARAAGTPAAGSPARALADVLAALGLVEVAGDGTPAVLSDPLERMLVDPAAELRARLATGRAALLAALTAWLGDAAAEGDELSIPVGAGLILGVTLDGDAPHLTVATAPAGLRLGDAVDLDGRLTLSAGGRLTGELAAGRGGLGLRATVDSTAGNRLSLTLDPPGNREPMALAPLPDAPRLARSAATLVVGELARIVLEWADREAPALAGPAITALGLRGSVRSPAPLLTDPAGWLAEALPPRPDGRPGISSAGLANLIEAARAGLAPAAPPGALPLPFGLALTAEEAAGDPVAVLGWATPAPAGNALLGGALRLRLGPDHAVTPAVDARVELTGLTGLDRVGLGLNVDGDVTAGLRVRPTAAGDEIVVPLLPNSGGLGALTALAAGAAVDALLPLALDALGRHPDLGPPVVVAGDALGLRPSGSSFDAVELRELAGDPAGQLAARLTVQPVAVLDAAVAMADTVLPVGTVTAGTREGTGVPFLRATLADSVAATLDVPGAGAPSLCIEVTDGHPLPALTVSGRACASSAGFTSLRAAVEATDPAFLSLGAAAALPFVSVTAGAAGNRIEAGIWTAPATAPTRRALVAQVPLDGSPASLVCRSGDGGPDDPDLSACFAEAVRVWLVPLAVELLTGVDAVVERLERPLPFAGTAGTTLGSLLADVQLLTRSAGPRYDLAPGALNAAELGNRVLALAAQVVRRIGEAWEGPGALHPLTLGLASDDHGGRTVFGIRLGLAEPLQLFAAGGLELYLEAVAVPDFADVSDPGITLLMVSLPAGSFDPSALEIKPWIKVTGVGLRAAGEQGGKLVDLIASVDAVALHGVFERNDAEPAENGLRRAGARLLLVNFGVPVGAAGGGNPVAQKLLSGGDQPTNGDETPLRPAFSPQLTIVRAPPAATVVRFGAGEGDGPWWLPIQRRFGPLYVEQVGLGTDELPSGNVDRVKLLLDGGVSLAGLAVQVDDLSLSIPFQRPYALDEWRLDLAGLAVGYRGGAIEIAGGLRKRSGDPPDYVGMLLVRAGQFGLTAIGGYAELPVAPGSPETYTSLFVFAAISFPLGGPPAFFVTGLGGGVGLNRRLIVPDDVGRLPAFPLVAAMDPSSTFSADPMGALDSIGAAFPPERGRFWLAAGVRFTSFVLVEGLAVLSVEMGDDVEVNLLGLGRMSLPTPQLAITRIEIALRARFSSREMVLSAQAQLTDNSYVLHPACRLTGGFAMATWLRTGQSVLTLGGYHPRFAKPPEFPVVPRLGLSWLVSPLIAIKGEAYFALTSTCVMAGGRLEVAYRAGGVWASFTAGLDAIVSWDPFFYDVEVYVRVSAGVDIRIWTPFGSVRVRLSLSIGADLRVWGPELRGKAKLDLDVISVTVRFGGDGETTGNNPIGWHEFHEKYLVAGDPEGLTMSATILVGQLAPDPGAGRGTAETGRLDAPWRVQPEFVLQTATRAASNAVNGRPLSAVTPQAIDLGPMHKVGVVSTHTVVVRERRTGTDVTAQLTLHPVVGNVPEGIWRKLGAQPAAEANVRPAFVGAKLAAPAVVPGAEGFARLRQVEVSDVPLPLPFHDEIAQRDEFTGDVQAAERYVEAQPRAAGTILSRAAEKLTGIGPVDRRAFAADRVAPPRLAPLAEGMVDPLKPPVAKEPVPESPPEPVPSSAIVKPRLHAVLRGPAPAAPRAVLRTTVSREHESVPRRDVPTLARVRALASTLGAARLEIVDPRPARVDATLRASDGGPSTAKAGGLSELRRGYIVPEPAARSLEHLEHVLHDGGSVALTAGDVQVWELPNAHNDAGERRPTVVVGGDQLVRLVALDRAGDILADATDRTHRLSLPRGTARLAAAGLGWPGKEGEATTGLAGWHAASALRQVDANSYLGPRCVLTATSPDTRRGRRAVSAAVVRAAEAVFGRTTVTTRMPSGIRTLLLALETAEDPDDALAGLVMGIDGAARREQPPRVVVAGTRAHGIFTLRPERGANVEVTIASEERWRLAAVVGGALSAEETAARLVGRGLEAMVADEQASLTGTSELRWSEEG